MTLKLRSSIRPEVLNKALKRGMFFAGIGSCILLFSGVLIPEKYLKILGLPLILSSILLITLGLYPYQKLKRLEITPHEITILDENTFLFSWKRKPFLTIPFSEISSVKFIDSNIRYGIALDLRNLSVVKACNNEFDVTVFMKTCKAKYGCDLFLPYFSKRSFDELLNRF